MSRDIVLGGSFSPEYCKSIGEDIPLDLLKIVVEELNIRDIRLGLRWNVIEREKGISLDYYDKYLKYILKNRCKLTLNIGPIKVFRWPEEHIPKYYISKESDTVTSECDLGKNALEYLNKILTVLKKKYGKDLNDTVFQLDNEAFYRFGGHGITMSNGYVLDTVRVLKEYFPENRIMFSSAGRKNLRRVINIFDCIEKENIYKYESLILGFNYYFRLPNLPKVDPIKGFQPFRMSINRLKEIQRKNLFGLEISEGQFEPWGIADTPGNIYSEYLYLLDKCIEYFPDDYKYKLIRLWGVEELALRIKNKELNSEHTQIIKSIKYA